MSELLGVFFRFSAIGGAVVVGLTILGAVGHFVELTARHVLGF